MSAFCGTVFGCASGTHFQEPRARLVTLVSFAAIHIGSGSDAFCIFTSYCFLIMSGHSHWQNIQHKKSKKDKRRGKLFSKLSDQIAAAVKEGGKDPDFNPTLRTAIDEAKEANMPKENIHKAIDRGAGEGEFARNQHILEGYGPEGVAFLVQLETDNKNRAIADLRRIFEEYGGSLGEAGCTAYIFREGTPTFSVDISKESEERVNNLIDNLEDYEDVTYVFHNAAIS